MHTIRKTTILALFLTGLVGCDHVPEPVPNPGPELNIGDCDDYNPSKNLYFGDLHTHTSLSLDAVQLDTYNTPNNAYAFAKGEPIKLGPFDSEGNPTRILQLERPLDFNAVTDHAEYLAEADICFNLDSPYYYSPFCLTMRGSKEGTNFIDYVAFFIGLGPASIPGGNFKPSVCNNIPSLCDTRSLEAWYKIQNAAEDAYDRSSVCKFTSLIGYEWTGTPNVNNQHRNVLFRDANVPERPFSYFDKPHPNQLWDALDNSCNKNGTGCEAIAIPHNSNLSGSEMFQPLTEDGSEYDQAMAQKRQRLEPLVEIYQHKGSSECFNGNTPFASADEFCQFELSKDSICEGTDDDSPHCTKLCSDMETPRGGLTGGCVEPGDFVRGGLRKGLAQQRLIGENPFKFGIIASTDNHQATPGAASETAFLGHFGSQDDSALKRIAKPAPDPDNVLADLLGGLIDMRHYSPGGLAAVWAEQNSRHAIFDSLKNKETYGTSGTRITLRMFGGWNLPEDLCGAPNWVDVGYQQGAPMGGELPQSLGGDAQPTFIVSALMDPGTTRNPGTPLQQVQIIKGWEENGETFEKVYQVAGNAQNGAGVDINTCETYGSGFSNLCSVWKDPDFQPDQNAFYYSRVLENPTCRWSQRQCNQLLAERGATCDSLDSSDPLYACCDGETITTIQERAWSSPIWYEVQ